VGTFALVACAGALATVGLIASCASLGDLSGGGPPDPGDATADGSTRADSGGADSGSRADAQADTLDPGDAGHGDSGDANDAADADAAEAACTGTWCSCQTPPHKLCNDFDNGLLFNDPVWPLTTSTMATVTLDDGGTGSMRDYTSPPYSAHFSVGTIQSGTGLPLNTVVPSISHQVIGAVTQLTCAMDLLVLNESPISQTFVQPLLLLLATTNSGQEVAFYQVGTGAANAGIGVLDSTPIDQPLPLQVGWTRYWFAFVPPRADAGTDYEFLAGFGTAGASVVGTLADFTNTGFTIQVGIPGSSIGNGGWDVLIDNVTCDW
jgi:hypothetical protein